MWTVFLFFCHLVLCSVCYSFSFPFLFLSFLSVSLVSYCFLHSSSSFCLLHLSPLLLMR